MVRLRLGLAGAILLGGTSAAICQPRPLPAEVVRSVPAASLGTPTANGVLRQVLWREDEQSTEVEPPQVVITVPPAELPQPAQVAAPIARALPINLATALHLANARPLDVAIAARQVEIAAAALDRARLLWAPNVLGGGDYFRHEGPQQIFAGESVSSSRQSAMVGGSLNAAFAVTDAIFGPLAARQDLRASEARAQAATNDITLSVAEAYFNVQQARGEYAGYVEQVREAEELSRRTKSLAEGLSPPVEATRARVELARRRQAAAAARERWATASAELARLLRLDPSTLLEPIEPPELTVPLVDGRASADELIPLALTNRPELAAHQAVVRATLQRLRQEKLRPLIPSILIRGASTPVTGTLAFGSFAGGRNGQLGAYDLRMDYDAQLLWEFQNLGLGNRARIRERRGEHEVALLELFRTQDRIAAEVSAELARMQAAATRLEEAEPALRDARDSLHKNMEGLSQTRRVGNILVLVIRPQEVVAALQALALANADYFSAVGDYNRAQFRLYRALGHPAQALADAVPREQPATNPRPAPTAP